MTRFSILFTAVIILAGLTLAACSPKENEVQATVIPQTVPTVEASVTQPPTALPEPAATERPMYTPYIEPETEIPERSVADISGLTSQEVTARMGAGWNLGNTLDAHWNARPWGTIAVPKEQETMWGNPVTYREMIEFVRDSGFGTVRVPVTWYIFTGDGPEYQVDPAWMDRVQEVVDYVIDAGMFCILNIHHDDYLAGSNWHNGWLTLYGDGEPLSDGEKAEMNNRFARLWEQIAERFKDYDEYLLFEGINEPRTYNLQRETRETWEEQSRFLNELLQTFVDTVRASGGNNPNRHLLITPYFASVGMDANDGMGRIMHFVDKENKKLWVNDGRERLIASIHYYEPWGFVTAPSDSQWFSAYFDLNVGSVSHNLNNVFRIIKENFTDLGIPVIMGETGALHRTMPDGGDNEAERVKWAQHYVKGLYDLGVPTVIWDDGGGFRLLDRRTLEWVWPDLAAALVEASRTGDDNIE
jgi:endoglucanase